MSIEVMVRQMTAGFGQTCLIFFLTLIFFPSTGNDRIFWTRMPV